MPSYREYVDLDGICEALVDLELAGVITNDQAVAVMLAGVNAGLIVHDLEAAPRLADRRWARNLDAQIGEHAAA